MPTRLLHGQEQYSSSTQLLQIEDQSGRSSSSLSALNHELCVWGLMGRFNLPPWPVSLQPWSHHRRHENWTPSQSLGSNTRSCFPFILPSLLFCTTLRSAHSSGRFHALSSLVLQSLLLCSLGHMWSITNKTHTFCSSRNTSFPDGLNQYPGLKDTESG